MSGHNKWSKIKHKKAATDAERSRLFSKHARLITMESRLAGGNITSPSLTSAIDRAKRDSMPKENIDRAVAKGADTSGAALESVLFETYGPGGVAILITAVTDNNNRTSQEIKHLLSKAGYQLGTPGSASWAFVKEVGGYCALSPVELTTEDTLVLTSLIALIEEHDDVQDIYTTADDSHMSIL